MNYWTKLMDAMLAHGYTVQLIPSEGKVAVSVTGPGFSTTPRKVDSYSTAVGLAAYWLSETNGVPAEAKAAVDAILYQNVWIPQPLEPGWYWRRTIRGNSKGHLVVMHVYEAKKASPDFSLGPKHLKAGGTPVARMSLYEWQGPIQPET